MLQLWVLISQGDQFGDWVRIPTETNPWPKIRSMQRWIHTWDTLDLPHFQLTVVPTPQQYNTRSTDCPQEEGAARDMDGWYERLSWWVWVSTGVLSQEFHLISNTLITFPEDYTAGTMAKFWSSRKQIFTVKTKNQTEQEYAQLSLLNSLQNFPWGLHKSSSFKRLLKMWNLGCSHETVLTLR